MRKIVEHKRVAGDTAFGELLERINHGEKSLAVSGLMGSAKSFVMASLFRQVGTAMIVICPGEKEAKDFSQDLSFFLGHENVFFYPPWDILSLDMFSFHREVELARVEVLCRLLSGEKIVVVIPLKAIMQRVSPLDVLSAYCQTISIGDILERDSLVEKLLAGGYSRASLVEEKGEFSLRGSIIDIFTPCAARPVRMECVGDELESIRSFDTASQRSVGERDEFILTPARELILSPERKLRALRNIRCRVNDLDIPLSVRNRLVEVLDNGFLSSINPMFLPLFYESFRDSGSGEGLGDFFDYLPVRCIAVIDDSLAIEQAREGLENQIDRLLLRAVAEQKFFLDKESSYLGGKHIQERLADFPRITFAGLILGATEGDGEVPVRFLAEVGEKFRGKDWGPQGEEGLFGTLAEKIRNWLETGTFVVFICAGQEEVQRAAYLLGHHDLSVTTLPASVLLAEIESSKSEGRLILVEGRVTRGFHMPLMKLAVISGEDVFGKKITRGRIRPAREGYFLRSFGELKEGDCVVHTDHGIGLYQGLQKLAVGRIENDFLLIEYQGNDRLYIPIDRLDRIQRYVGPDGYMPKIDKLGGASWETAKERVKKSIREVAEELVSVYAARELLERSSFSPPDDLYEEFCSTFEFEETPDQVRAIEDIHDDMNGVKPMDRLICGDAGFGKTEVALRASFRAVMDGKQVAILVPTTILAEQHYQTFTQRLND